jgi:hypothetical protein
MSAPAEEVTVITNYYIPCGLTLKSAYNAGGAGTYILNGDTWTKQ